MSLSEREKTFCPIDGSQMEYRSYPDAAGHRGESEYLCHECELSTYGYHSVEEAAKKYLERSRSELSELPDEKKIRRKVREFGKELRNKTNEKRKKLERILVLNGEFEIKKKEGFKGENI